MLGNKKFFLAHGDGLGPGDKGYKFLKKTFESRLNQWLYRWIHPDLGTRLGSYFSRRSRLTKMLRGEGDIKRRVPVDEEPMVIFSRELALNDRVRDLARDLGIACVDLEKEFAGGEDLTIGDGLHPNDAGTQIIALAFADLF